MCTGDKESHISGLEDFIAKLIRMVEVDLEFYGAKQGNIQEQTRGTCRHCKYCINAINDCPCMFRGCWFGVREYWCGVCVCVCVCVCVRVCVCS